MPTVIDNGAGEFFCFALAAATDRPFTFAARTADSWFYTDALGDAYTFETQATLRWLTHHRDHVQLTYDQASREMLAWVPVRRLLPIAERWS